jgi:lipoprotein-anchoring transpeptidase ErfK/SrfK
VLVLTALAGCGQVGQAKFGGRIGSQVTPVASGPGPEITTNVQGTMAFDDRIVVKSPEGTLESVTVSGEQHAVEGTWNESRNEWVSSQERAPGVTYQLVATATDDSGARSTLERSFGTGSAPRVLTADVSPYGGQKVGIGQPIVVKLSSSVSGAAGRRAVEKGLVVTADKDLGESSWHWTSSTEVHFRPKEFWPGNTKVTVSVNFLGVQGGKGLWGTENRSVEFVVGRAFIMNINDDNHMMIVTQDGKMVRKIPVSMGRGSYATRSGIKTIMSHERSVRMTSESWGGEDFYDQIVHYAQRLTWSGEYIHSAPWSVYAQGRQNVSHGCVNVSPTNAIWLFERTLIGDPVVTTGTSRQMEPTNGTGGDWNISWSDWVAGSALSED